MEEWNKKRPKASKNLRDARERASKEISHLTTFRREPKDDSKKWFFLTLMRDVENILRIFVENASPSKLNGSVVDLVNAISLNATTAGSPDSTQSINATTTAFNITVSVPPQATNMITSVGSSNAPFKRP
jgi:hypothetical protein